MAINLLDLAKNAIGDQIIEHLGGIVGESSATTRAAADKGLPAILGGLLNKANQDTGADELFRELDNYDGGILDNLGDILTGDGLDTLRGQGGGLMDVIFGASRGGVVAALARMLGLNDTKLGSLLTLLAPIVMNLISRQRAATPDMTSDGLKQMLFDQKDILRDELPKELRSEMGLTNIFEDAQDLAADAREAVADTARATVDTASDAVESAQAGIGRFLPWIIAAVLALLLWMFWPTREEITEETERRMNETVIEREAVAPPDPVAAPQPAAPDVETITQQLIDTFGNLSAGVQNIDSIESARGFTSQLASATQQVNRMGLDALPESDLAELRPTLENITERLRAVLEPAYQIPGVRNLLEPTAEPMLNKLENL